MGGKVEVKRFDQIISNINDLNPKIQANLLTAMDAACEIMYIATVKHADLACHSLDELAAMGHPYAKYARDGRGRVIGVKGQDSGPHPDEFVHTQSGLLMGNIEKIVELAGSIAITAVGVDENKVPYVKWLIDGTSKMRPRDFLGHAWLETKDAVVKKIITTMQLGRAKSGSREGVHGR